MALTKVSGHIIDQPFDVGIITATNQYVSGIGTFGNIRVLGDLQVDGTTTTLDTVVTEVDRLEVAANNNTVAIAVTQSGSGHAAIFMGGKVGIGTNVPAAELEVYGNARFKDADGSHGIEFYPDVVGLGYQRIISFNRTSVAYEDLSIGVNDFIVTTGSANERLRITSGGNMGLGTTVPTNISNFTSFTLNGTTGGNIEFKDDNVLRGSIYNLADQFIVQAQGSSTPLALRTNSNERLRITSDGKVGIGLTNPGEKLSVNGGIEARGGGWIIARSGNNSGYAYIKNPEASGSQLAFLTSDTERLRITSAGNIGIGTDAPGALLSLESTAANAAKIRLGFDGPRYYDIFRGSTTNSGYLNFYGSQTGFTGYIFDGVDGERMRIDSAGRLGLNQTSINATRMMEIKQPASYTSALRINTAGSAGNPGYIEWFSGVSNYKMGVDHNSDNLRIKRDNTTQIRIDSAGNFNLESDTAKFTAGAGNDLQIYHNGTNSFIENGAGELLIRAKTSENSINCNPDGSVELFYDNSKKLETTTTGVTVTGSLTQTTEYPSIRPTLDLNFAATKTLDRRITFTRNSLGTFTDDMGIVKYASNNVPRFDHDPATGESLGLLIEESRVNLLVYSSITSGEGIGTGYANGGTTVSKGSNATAPDGTLTAWNSVYNGTSGDAALYKAGGEITTTNSTSYTLSVFAKVPSTNTYVTGVRLRTYNSNHSGGFNLLTGTILGTAEGTTTNRIEAYPNGWYRCSITFTSGTDGNQGVQFYLINNASTALNSSSANGEELYLWGAQLEQGSFPTSYIPTSGTTVTRAADIAKITGTNFTDFHNATEGTLYGEYKATLINNAPYVVMLSDGTNNNRTIINSDYSSYQGVVKYNNGTNQAVLDGGTPTLGGNNKTTLAFKKDDFALSLNGGTVATDTSGDVSVNNMMSIGSRHGSDSFMNTTIKAIKYYTKRLPNAQLQGLTQQ